MKRILVVEDHGTSRQALQRLLQLRGYSVVAVESISAASAVLAHNVRFDVLVSDLLLQDGTGWDLLTSIPEPHRPRAAIAVSGSGMENEVERSLEAGFCMHLNKPLTLEMILEAIDRCTAEAAPQN